MINWSILVPSLVSIAVIIYLNVILVKYFNQLERSELKLLHIPLLASLFVPSGYLGMALLSGNQYQFFASLIFQVSFAFVFLITTNLLFLVIYHVIEKPISRPLILIIAYNTIIMPLIYLKFTEVEWSQTGWDILYSPSYMFVFSGIGLVIFVLGLNILLYELFKSSPYRDIRILIFLLNLSAFLALLLLSLREALDIPINTWTIGIALMYLVFTLIVMRRPEIFLTSSKVPVFLLILNKEMGTPVKLFHFVKNEMEASDEMLFSGAFTAVQSVIEESIRGSDRIKYIGLEEYHLEIVTKDQFEFILASKDPSSALRSILEKIANNWDIDLVQGQLQPEDAKKMRQLVHNYFIHQIRRLDLLLDQVQVEEITSA